MGSHREPLKEPAFWICIVFIGGYILYTLGDVRAPYEAVTQGESIATGDDSYYDVPDPKPVVGSQWNLYKETSPIDDSENVYLSVRSDEPIPDRYGGVEWPLLWVRCKENTTAVYIQWEVYLGLDETSITYRIDKEQARTETWRLATNNESIGRWSGGSAIPFIQRLLGKEQILFRITPYGENSVMATFNISGLEDKITPLRKACGW